MFPLETKILIVDDMPAIRDLLKGQLRGMGYKVIHDFQDGEAAKLFLVDSFASGAPVQLVISDWNMPKLTGLELLKQVRSSKHMLNLPFILLTSESERDQVTEAILSGVSQYVVKPFTGKMMEEKMKSAWQKHHAAK